MERGNPAIERSNRYVNSAADSLQIAQTVKVAQFTIVAEQLTRRCGEEVAQLLGWCVFHHKGVPDAARQDQRDAAVADLLVLAHMAEQPVGRDAFEPDLGEPRRQAAAFEVAAYPQRIPRRDEAELCGEVGRKNHAERHRLTVQQARAEPGLGLQSVPEGVAEIEQRAVALLAFVAGDDLGFHRAAGQHRAPQRLRSKRTDLVAFGFEPGEKFGVTDEAVFDDLGIAGEQLAARQAPQNGRVGEHETRLVEGADQILAGGGVDPGLAADRAVYLSQECRRDLREIDPAQQGCRSETGEVADNAAAERDEHRAALDADRENVLGEPAEMVEVLGLLARRHEHRVMRDPGRGEAVAQRREVMAGDDLVRYDDGLTAPQQRQYFAAGALDEPRADEDVIGALPELDAQSLDGLRGLARIRRKCCSTVLRPSRCASLFRGAAAGGVSKGALLRMRAGL